MKNSIKKPFKSILNSISKKLRLLISKTIVIVVGVGDSGGVCVCGCLFTVLCQIKHNAFDFCVNLFGQFGFSLHGI